MTVHFIGQAPPERVRLDNFAQALLQAKDFLHSTEVLYAHTSAPEHVYPLLRAARASLNEARRAILEEAHTRYPERAL